MLHKVKGVPFVLTIVYSNGTLLTLLTYAQVTFLFIFYNLHASINKCAMYHDIDIIRIKTQYMFPFVLGALLQQTMR